MTRSEAVDFIKHLLFEDAATTALASTDQFSSTLDIANKTVWVKVADAQPSLLMSQSPDVTYSASAGYYSLATLDPYILGRVEVKDGTVYRRIEPMQDQEQLEYTQTGSPVAYWLEGENLRLVPDPTSDQTMRIQSVARLGPLLDDSDQLLDGYLPEFHQLVCYEATLLLCAKDESPEQFRAYTKIRDELYKDLRRYLSRRNTYRPHFIREVSPE